MGKLIDEAKKKEAAQSKGLLERVEVEYTTGRFKGKKDLILKSRAVKLKKLGKIVMILALLSIGIGINAQNFTIYKNMASAPILIINDTIDDTEANDTTILFKLPHDEPWAYSLHLICATISGTTDVDVDYQWSNNGSDWLTFASDSMAAGNLQFIQEDLTGFGARYLRILRTGVGTNSTKMQGYLYPFKVPGAK